MEFLRHPERRLIHFVAAPFVYSMLVPLVLLDACLEIYHRVCFPLYGLPCVKRTNYILIDRDKLKYLKLWERMNCVYCGYANGLVHYASAIGAETERYWCGIQHKKTPGFVPPANHADFIPYGDEAALKSFVNKKD